jgi:hypothetical protein
MFKNIHFENPFRNTCFCMLFVLLLILLIVRKFLLDLNIIENMPTKLSDPGMNLGQENEIDSYEQWINFKNHKLQMLNNLKNKNQSSFVKNKEFFNPNNEMLYNYENIPPVNNELDNLIYQEYISTISKDKNRNKDKELEDQMEDPNEQESEYRNIPEPNTDRPDLNNCIPCKPCKPCKA